MAIEKHGTLQDISWFLDLYYDKKLNFNHIRAERRTWGGEYKELFLDTIFENYPCSPIYIQKKIDENFNVSFNVIDGRQRLRTIFDFYVNLTPLPSDKNLYYYDNITINNITRKKFLNYSMFVVYLPSFEKGELEVILNRLSIRT